jgi:plasmid stability protein
MWYTGLVENRNITFSLPTDLVRQAKVYAAEHDTTINSLVRDILWEKLTTAGRARAAADRLLALAERGPYFATDPGSISRDQLHERQ